MSVPKTKSLHFNSLEEAMVHFGTLWYGSCDEKTTSVPPSPKPFRVGGGTVLRRKSGDLEEVLKTISSLAELEGFANSSKLLGVNFDKWSDKQRSQIMRRKWELENGL